MWDITDLEEVDEELLEVEVTYEDSLWQEDMSGDHLPLNVFFWIVRNV